MNHREAWDLIPWLVNERIDATARAGLQQHLEQCAECATEVGVQAALLGSMHAAARVEAMPPASLQRLWARIDAEPRLPVPTRPAANEHAFRFSFAHVAMVAAVALLAGVAFTSAWHGLNGRARADFRTVSDAVNETPGIRVVFDTSMSVARLQALLESHGLLIVSGPSASGVYTLRSRSNLQRPDAALTALRAEQEVRFAEPVGR